MRLDPRGNRAGEPRAGALAHLQAPVAAGAADRDPALRGGKAHQAPEPGVRAARRDRQGRPGGAAPALRARRRGAQAFSPSWTRARTSPPRRRVGRPKSAPPP